jgi:hypothetical protein
LTGWCDRRGATVVSIVLGGLASSAFAQELVPAAYTPAPYGVNLVSFAAVYNSGDLAFDPAGPIEDASAKIFASTVGYARTLGVAGRAANIGVIVPYVLGEVEGIYIGEQAFAERSGFGDLALRFAVNLFGAPAMSPKEFSTFRPRTLIGVSLVVRAPTGQYDPSKLINIGTNRWAFKPEIGFVRVIGRWAIDAYVGGWLFTDNTDFFGGLTREQDPILSTQFHVRYLIQPGLWAAIDGNFWRGGQTTVAGTLNDDKQHNSRVGLTVSMRLGRSHSLRVAASRGAITRIGGDFSSIGVSYGYSWVGKP